jgi:hypothetical protein
MQTASSGVARWQDHDPATLAIRGLLVEEARTNLLTYSSSVGGTNWISTHSPTLNAAVAPDGTTTMTQANPAAATSQIYQTLTLTAATTYYMSIYAKAGTSARSRLQLFDNTGVDAQAILEINWTAGVPSQHAIAGSAASITFTDVGGGIYRIGMAATSDATNTSHRFQWYSDISAGTGTTFVWGAQLEAGAFATSYIPSTSASVTRAADAVSLATTAFNAGASAATRYVAAYVLEKDQDYARPDNIFVLDAGVNRMTFSDVGGANSGRLAHYNGTSTTGTANAISDNTNLKLALAGTSSDRNLVLNGGTIAESASTIGLPATSIGFGGSNCGQMWYRQIMDLPVQLSDADLQTLTT